MKATAALARPCRSRQQTVIAADVAPVADEVARNNDGKVTVTLAKKRFDRLSKPVNALSDLVRHGLLFQHAHSTGRFVANAPTRAATMGTLGPRGLKPCVEEGDSVSN